MEIIIALLLALVTLAAIAVVSRPRRRLGPTVAEIQARLATEQRTFVPSRGW